jgi:hypothetical protein
MTLQFCVPCLSQFVLFVALVGCHSDDHDSAQREARPPMRDINLVKDAHSDELMQIPGVVGVYVGELADGTPCIGVMVLRRTPEIERRIPKAIEGHPVKIDETGEIRPFK